MSPKKKKLKNVNLTIEDAVARIQLNRPEKKNAIDREMFEGLRETAQALAVDPSLRAVVLSGAGNCFSAGLDLSNFSEMAFACR